MWISPQRQHSTDVRAVKDSVGVLLRTEQTAASIYERVLDMLGDEAPRRLREMQAEHMIAAHELRRSVELVRLDDLDPEVDVDVTFEFVQLLMRMATHSCRRPALEVLRQVERGTIDDYEGVLAEGLVGPRLARMVAERLLPSCHRHIRALERMLAAHEH